MARKPRITSQVSALGQNLLMVFAGSKKSGGVNSGLGSASAITLEDAEARSSAKCQMWQPSARRFP